MHSICQIFRIITRPNQLNSTRHTVKVAKQATVKGGTGSVINVYKHAAVVPWSIGLATSQ